MHGSEKCIQCAISSDVRLYAIKTSPTIIEMLKCFGSKSQGKYCTPKGWWKRRRGGRRQTQFNSIALIEVCNYVAYAVKMRAQTENWTFALFFSRLNSSPECSHCKWIHFNLCNRTFTYEILHFTMKPKKTAKLKCTVFCRDSLSYCTHFLPSATKNEPKIHIMRWYTSNEMHAVISRPECETTHHSRING